MYKPRRQQRYQRLKTAGFLPWEARRLSILPVSDPALQLLAKERTARRAAFIKEAGRQVAAGDWRRREIPYYWRVEILDLYHRKGWIVKGEYLVGTLQPRMRPGSPNPWAMYRDAEKEAPPKRHVSPWQLKGQHKPSPLQRGLIAIQRKERQARAKGGTLPRHMLIGWIKAKERALSESSGARQAEIKVELNRLRAMLARAA